MRYGQTIAAARKVWADLQSKDTAPETAQLRAVRHEVTTRLRATLPNTKGYGNQYPWNSPKFDHYIIKETT
jgi:hypothetical protein